MSAGTLTLANNTNVVSGIDTYFTSEFSAGDFIVMTTGGVTYTLPVKSIESDTALTLARNYNGPAVTDAAWTAMPRDTLNRISAQVAADTAYIIRQRVLEVDNWYQLLEVNGNVTIKMADGSSYTGPSWLKLIDVMHTLGIDELIPLAEQIHADAVQVAEDKQVIIQAKGDAEAAAAAAAAAEGSTSAAEEATAVAQAAAERAQAAAEKAAEEAASHNPVEALVKSNNLSDLENREESWMNVRPVGSTPLAADPVSAYDAATKRWTENLVGAGTTGPTMNGVLNFGIGSSELWQSRAFIPPWALTMDGQLVNRADWPELWAHAQQHGAIDDADWIADPTKRGAYSEGDGSTTFRLPDKNGVQKQGVNGFTGPSSYVGLYERGDAAGGYVTQSVIINGAPEIIGTFNQRRINGDGQNTYGLSGAFTLSQPAGTQLASYNATAASALPEVIRFRASDSNAAYGRASDVRPNSVIGVWIVRASGGFVAANTSWSVINSDATRPTDGVTVSGGDIKSQYKIGTTVEAEASFKVMETIGGNAWARISVTNATDGTTVNFDLDSKNRFYAGGYTAQGGAYPSYNYRPLYTDGTTIPDTVVGGLGAIEYSYAKANTTSSIVFIRRRGDGNNTGQIVVNVPTTSGTLALQGTSGLDYKHDITDADTTEAVSRIDSLRMVNFIYNDDEQNRVRYGIIAEETEKTCPQYIKHNQEQVEDILDDGGNKIGAKYRDRPSVDVNPIVMDLLGYVKALRAEIDELKAALKS